jgi:hypothetical protein
MDRRFAVVWVVFGVIACSESDRAEDPSDLSPSTAPLAGSGAYDPSLDTPRELREDAGPELVAADHHTPPDSGQGMGAGAGAAGSAARAMPCKSLVLIADDGTFLGEASSKPYESNGVCNPYSLYGSAYGKYSIFNETGVYGSDDATTSAFNEFGSRPPHLYCESTSESLNPITKNEFLPGAIDPDVLCQTLSSNGY